MSKVINEIVVNGETYDVEFKNQVVDGDITAQNGKFISKSTNIDKDVIPESDTWGNSRIDIQDTNGNRLAFIQPKQTTTGETDLHIVRDGSNNPNGKVLINGVDIEQINNDLSELYKIRYKDIYVTGSVPSAGGGYLLVSFDTSDIMNFNTCVSAILMQDVTGAANSVIRPMYSTNTSNWIIGISQLTSNAFSWSNVKIRVFYI